MMNKLEKEWRLFQEDFKRQANESLIFRINWYILKPIAILMVIVAIIITVLMLYPQSHTNLLSKRMSEKTVCYLLSHSS